MGRRYSAQAKDWVYVVVPKAGGRFAGLHWRDERNALNGIRCPDRIRLIEASLHALERARRQAFVHAGDEEQKVIWFALALLGRLVDKAGLRWGVGPPGSAKLPSGASTKRGSPSTALGGWRDELLLNMVEEANSDERFHGINYPHAIRRLRWKLWKEMESVDALLPSRMFSVDVLTSLHTLRGMRVTQDDQARWAQMLAASAPIKTAVLKRDFTHRTVPVVLSYYGAGSSIRHRHEGCIQINRGRLLEVLHRSQEPGGLDLRDLVWMDGRYQFQVTR